MTESPKGPFIYPDVNNDNNTTLTMEVGTLYSTIITDGIATIENGYISNLIEPTEDNQIATKYYVDNSSGGGGTAGGPPGSIQYNSGGVFAGTSNLTFSSPTLNINGTLTNGTITISGSQITGLVDPTLDQEAATKNYVDQSLNKLGIVNITLEQKNMVTYTPSQIYNNIVNLTMNNNYLDTCPVDSLPTGTDMQTYLGTEFTVGKTWTTIFRGPQTSQGMFVRFIGGDSILGNPVSPITYLYCGFPLPAFCVVNYSVITLTCVVTNTSTPNYNAYVTSNLVDITTETQITNQGILTPSIGSGSVLSTGSIIYPMLSSPQINSSSAQTYTYANLQKTLIIRTGLTAPTSDTFVTASVMASNAAFTMGGGTIKFWVQNPTAHNLTLLQPTGWTLQSGNSAVIPAGYCGCFWVTINISVPSCILYSLGTQPLSS